MAVPARMGKVGSGTVRSGLVWLGSRGTDVMGRVGYGAAGICSGMVRWGMKRSVKGQAGICKGAAGTGRMWNV